MSYEEIMRIAERLHSQQGYATAHPIYEVQVEHRVYGLGPGYTDDYEWVAVDADAGGDPPDDADAEAPGWERVGYKKLRETVTFFLTHEGALEYIRKNAHNLVDPMVYVSSGHRNEEYRIIREFIKGLWVSSTGHPITVQEFDHLAAAAPEASEVPPCGSP